jgi:uncharacterized protein (TIGR03067 family)
MRREISLLLVLATILTFSTIRSLLGEETKKRTFLELASGNWTLELISFDGKQIDPKNSIYKNATAVVKGNVLTNRIESGDFIYELEDIDDSKDPVSLTLVRRKDDKVGHLKALAKITNDRFVLSHGSLQQGPSSIEPAEGNTVRVWVRPKSK